MIASLADCPKNGIAKCTYEWKYLKWKEDESLRSCTNNKY